jgi:hypothetical protein
VKGILADNNVIGQVTHLVRLMQAKPWEEFWKELGLVVCQFNDVGLLPTATDVEVWQQCQARELILITDNRNDDRPDSLSAAIRNFNNPSSLPVFTIADVERFRTNPVYREEVVIALYDYCCGSTMFAAPAGCSCRESHQASNAWITWPCTSVRRRLAPLWR